MPNSISGHLNPFGNFSHNHVIMLSERRLDLLTEEGGMDYRIFVSGGGLSESFESRASDVGFEQKTQGPIARLTWTGGDRSSDSVVYTLTGGDGSVAVFRPLGDRDCSDYLRCAYVSHITHPDGTRLDFDYAYDLAAGGNRARLRRITSSRGYALLFQGFSTVVTGACVVNLAHTPLPADGSCPTGALTAGYGYVGAQLSHVDAPDGSQWRFTYGPGAGEMNFWKPGETAPWLTNRLFLSPDDDGVQQEVVSQQLFATGETYNYGWNYTPQASNRSTSSVRGGFYTNAEGHEFHYTYAFPILPGTGPTDKCLQLPCALPEPIPNDTVQYQQTPGPVEIIDQLSRATTTDYRNPDALEDLPEQYENRCYVEQNPVSFTDPEGITTFPTFDGARNLTRVRRLPKPGSTEAANGPAEIVTSATYNILNPVNAAKPTSTTDANGNVTSYSYDPVHGGLLTETGPAVNGVQPQTRHTYAQRHAWISNGAGGFVQSGPPLWVRTATSTCRTSAATGNEAAPCTAAGDEVRTTYDYGPDAGPNNLQLRGIAVTADGETRRTCYGYDANGRRISETSPGAGLATCS